MNYATNDATRKFKLMACSQPLSDDVATDAVATEPPGPGLSTYL